MNNKEVLMEKELENKRKLTKEVKENMNKMIFINLNIAILFMLIMIGINIAYLNVSSEKFILFIKLFSILSVFSSVLTFEIAYRKESVSKMFYGIELLVLSIIIMYIPYVYLHMPQMVKQILMLAPLYFSIYYVAKSIFINRKVTREYINNLSDVKEIVKDEENDSYLDEESTKIIKEINAIEEAKKEEKRLIKEAKKKQKQNEKVAKKTTKKDEEKNKTIKESEKNEIKKENKKNTKTDNSSKKKTTSKSNNSSVNDKKAKDTKNTKKVKDKE